MSTDIAKKESAEISNPRSTLEKAIEKGMDPETISKLMDLQERWEAGQARKLFVEAMAGFKKECPAVIGKDRKADFGAGKAKYSYATTGAIVTAITPALSKFGLSLSWETKQEIKLVTVTCHVTHQGGHRESATLTGPHDESGGKNPIQTLGSSVHYLQRYTLVSVLGLATADMDDADEGGGREPIKPPQEKQAATPPSAPDGAQVVTGTIETVSAKDGTGKNGPWRKYGIKIGDAWYTTFDRSLGADAEELKGCEVKITYSTDAKGYHNVIGMEVCK